VAVQAILTDIEGTTSSISFVYDVLFPYARERMKDYVQQHAAELNEQLETVRLEAQEPEADPVRVAEILVQWMAEDRKATVLKDVQGKIWREGYLSGALQGHVYADAVNALQQWHAMGLQLYVYSSGSIEAQKLIFGYSVAGDLTSLFTDYFDTTSGAKRERESYQRIADAIAMPADSILFLSDIVQELDAAEAAGMQTCGLAREGGVLGDHQTVASFAEVKI